MNTPKLFNLISYTNYSKLNGYGFLFNGKENDDEVKGQGNQQDYGMRIYDPRIGRFLSVDPLTQDYPWYTPYQFTGNNPIRFVDLDGLEPLDPMAFIWQGFGDGFSGIANWVDNIFSWGTETTVTTPTSTKQNGNVTTTSGIEVKNIEESSTNFGGVFSTVRNNGSPTPMDELPPVVKNKSTTTASPFKQVEVKTKLVSIVAKATANQNEAKVEASATVKVKVYKVPVDVKVSTTTSTNGQSDTKIQAAVPIAKSSASASATYSTNPASKKSSIKISAGGETKIGNVKISKGAFIKAKTE